MMNAPSEKPIYPPAYNEIYPNMNPNDPNNASPQMGWQPQPPPSMPPQTIVDQQNNLSITPRQSTIPSVLVDQSRIGLYPLKLQPCPHCQRDGKTTVKQESTMRTHALALILCVLCCCCCAPFAYCTNNMTKTANHFCEHCNAYIGSYKRRLMS